MRPNPLENEDLVTFTEKIIENFVSCTVETAQPFLVYLCNNYWKLILM